MIIRAETASDIGAITEVTKAAFANHPHSEQTEHFIVNALRAAEALTISLVAKLDGDVVGHIAFSRVKISDGSPNWYGLGPISVLPVYQRKGVGSALIREGLSLLRKAGATGCVLLGEPEYYGRFGFVNKPALILEGVPQEYFLAIDLHPNQARGMVTYHEAFSARG